MSSRERVLRALIAMKSEGVTFNHFGTGFRLSARIKDLRNVGHDIRTYTVEVVNSEGDPVKYARYVLVKKSEETT